jgi:hypothetical protein
MEPRDPALQLLLDKQEIREVMLRYCRGIDRRDMELVRAAFHADAYDDHGPFQGNAEDFPAWTMSILEKQKLTMHLVANQLIEVDGDVAFSESYLLALHRIERGDSVLDWLLGARYVDRFERRNGDWKIAHRTTVHDWNRFAEVAETWAQADQFVQGQHSHDDPAFRRS